MAIKKMKNENLLYASLLIINRGQRPIILEVESATKLQTKFADDYSKWTGKTYDWAKLEKDGFAVDIGTGKWGAEYRIYFTKDETLRRQFKRYGFDNVENGDVRKKGTYRINSKELFEELVKNHGFRLGENM